MCIRDSYVTAHGIENNVFYEKKALSKHEVFFKFAGEPYHKVTAAANDIYYPATDHGQIYAGYADVTDYVKMHGIGEYAVADMALTQGNGGSTGYFGCWSLIVVYENDKMNWRDITIFNGHAFNQSPGNQTVSSFDIPVSGFSSVQNGQVNVKIGYMAGEGDRGIQGDFMSIQKLNTTNFEPLSHGLNSTNNFFNSSIFTGGNSRNPNLENNTGIDVAMFNINNTGNTIIDNGQTSTTLRVGTNQDLYTISMVAIGIDAYKPEVEGIIAFEAINLGPVGPPPHIVLPGEPVDYCVEIRNKGTEAIENLVLHIPLPVATDFVPGSFTQWHHTSVQPQDPMPTFDSDSKSISWIIGDLPLNAVDTTLLLKFCYQVTATTNCDLLANPECSNVFPMSGTADGQGAISGINFYDQPFIQGYEENGSCQGQPIVDPLIIEIDGEDYFNANCDPSDGSVVITIAPDGNGYPVDNIEGFFPPGTRFYNEFPLDYNSIEYDDNNPFPAEANSMITYYGIPLGVDACAIPLTINVLSSCGIILNLSLIHI